MADYITEAELTARLKSHGIAEDTTDVTTTADVQKEINAAVARYSDQVKDDQKKEDEKFFKDWVWRVPTELNGLKSEFTSFKAELVPLVTGWAVLNAALPSLWSLEEMMKSRWGWDYSRNGILMPPPIARRREQRALGEELAREAEQRRQSLPPDQRWESPEERLRMREEERRRAEEERRRAEEARRAEEERQRQEAQRAEEERQREAERQQAARRAEEERQREVERRREEERRQAAARPEPGAGGDPARTPPTRRRARRPTTPRPPSDPLGPVTRTANQVRPDVRGATGDLGALRRGLDDTSRAADGG
ncbi:hypothetical protein [Streptomyces rubrolavendulae]|uniref:Uncharacterized protein n=1 Tax=Streptomyces rubrolavendulae TaxID=285473 RepID=A0A1D8G4U4_9ACTN|nr:hypothetical protein [Streptomyces rubrolavendulae]AOT60458.1 hypothetical protein A4G23_03333 [Streptomyces rubrolavendulae]